jgi:hypothetical protein
MYAASFRLPTRDLHTDPPSIHPLAAARTVRLKPDSRLQEKKRGSSPPPKLGCSRGQEMRLTDVIPIHLTALNLMAALLAMTALVAVLLRRLFLWELCLSAHISAITSSAACKVLTTQKRIYYYDPQRYGFPLSSRYLPPSFPRPTTLAQQTPVFSGVMIAPRRHSPPPIPTS